MKTRTGSPPLHVHVTESTPVHVHVKRNQKTPRFRLQAAAKGGPGGLRSTALVKTRVPWIPPGKTSLRDASSKWEGPTNRLDIAPLSEPSSLAGMLRPEDLSADEEDVLHGRIHLYERKIDNLVTEVNSLKNESEQLSASQRVIREQEEELAEAAKELEVSEKENSRLRLSMEKIQEETDYTRCEAWIPKGSLAFAPPCRSSSAVNRPPEQLMTVLNHFKLSFMSGSEASLLARQKELLLQKLETFEGTNRTLRSLLREHHMREVLISPPCPAQYLTLEFPPFFQHLLVKLQERGEEVDQLTVLLQTEKDNAKTTGELSKVLESTRAHLQGQLRSKEAENNRLAIQIRNLDRVANQHRGEMAHVVEQLRELKQRADADKEALKKATRAQKQRAERSEDAVGQLGTQLLEKETQLADAVSAAESWNSRHSQLLKEKNHMEMEITVLNSRVADLSEQLRDVEDKARAEREGLLDRLHGLTSDYTALRLENQTLKATLAAMEEKLTLSQSDVQQVKASVKQYESLVESYKTQVQKTRAEADEYALKLEMTEKEAQSLREDLKRQTEQARGRLQGRLAQLEPLPEALKQAELQLQEAQERERAQERRSMELSGALAELRLKAEQQSAQAEAARAKNLVLLEENKHLQNKAGILERKLEEAASQNRDLLQVISKREETIHTNQLHLEEKSRECGLLARQLEEALEDARCQVAHTRERAASKERSTQAKLLDLESQLSRTKSELEQLRRAKEDAERRFQSRLQDVRDRLEQSDSTNRSLQNYVQFLKASYASVFGDSALASSAARGPSPL
uniref:Outer dense fiber protein 2 n=1 Tax=Scleropages formosus TaxID=113540 RepID=A0A8C9W5P6_SCLFO